MQADHSCSQLPTLPDDVNKLISHHRELGELMDDIIDICIYNQVSDLEHMIDVTHTRNRILSVIGQLRLVVGEGLLTESLKYKIEMWRAVEDTSNTRGDVCYTTIRDSLQNEMT